MDEKHVVTCFLEHGDKIALLKRSQLVGSHRGKWAGISGYIESGITPYEQAITEIWEEAGLDGLDIELVIQGIPLEVIDPQMERKWVVHPYRFRIAEPDKIQIDWENTELRWIDPVDIGDYETVPKLLETWQRVANI